jgi:hypothetical protein
MRRYIRSLVAAAFFSTTLIAGAASAQSDLPPIPPAVDEAYARITAHGDINAAMATMRDSGVRMFEEQIRINEIPAPPFKEQVRAEYYLKRMRELGLPKAYIDKEGNVIGIRAGSGGGPKLVVSAHLDTVFPEGTDVKVREKDGRYYAPGIGDDALGLTSIVVSHDVTETFEIADHVVILAHGGVAAQGTPAEMRASTDPLIYQFVHALSDGPVPFHYPAPSAAQDYDRRSA